MPYEKQEWKSGDVVTSAKLNHIEDGIGDNAICNVTITFSGDDPSLPIVEADWTAQEIYEAAMAGKNFRAIISDKTFDNWDGSVLYMQYVYHAVEDDSYAVTFSSMWCEFTGERVDAILATRVDFHTEENSSWVEFSGGAADIPST